MQTMSYNHMSFKKYTCKNIRHSQKENSFLMFEEMNCSYRTNDFVIKKPSYAYMIYFSQDQAHSHITRTCTNNQPFHLIKKKKFVVWELGDFHFLELLRVFVGKM